MTAYAELLRDPRWQKMRLEVLSRDGFRCKACFGTDQTLHVHHCYYDYGKKPWEYPVKSLVTLCEICHEIEGTFAKDAKSDLIKILCQHGFLYENLIDIATGFIHLDSDNPLVDASVVRWLLSNHEMFDEARKAYMASKASQPSAAGR